MHTAYFSLLNYVSTQYPWILLTSSNEQRSLRQTPPREDELLREKTLSQEKTNSSGKRRTPPGEDGLLQEKTDSSKRRHTPSGEDALLQEKMISSKRRQTSPRVDRLLQEKTNSSKRRQTTPREDRLLQKKDSFKRRKTPLIGSTNQGYTDHYESRINFYISYLIIALLILTLLQSSPYSPNA